MKHTFKKLNKHGPIPEYKPELGPCWLWEGKLDKDGYGKSKGKGVHRITYEIEKGPIPNGLQLDHLCRVRNCANPSHLEPVTSKTNTIRGIAPEFHRKRQTSKTNCPRNHPYSGNNLRVDINGRRHCIQCANLWHLEKKNAQTISG